MKFFSRRKKADAQNKLLSLEMQFCEKLDQLGKQLQILENCDSDLRNCIADIKTELKQLNSSFKSLQDKRRKVDSPPAEAAAFPAQSAVSKPEDSSPLQGRFKNLKIALPHNLEEALSHQQPAETNKPTLAPGSDGEHQLQDRYETKKRALNFYNKQVLSYLAPKMQEFILEQEFLFIATADEKGECDCTSKFGQPGFIRVLNEKYLMYPEYRGNGVMANLGNISENPHIALLILDVQKDTIGLHVNGKARIVENREVLQYGDKLPADIVDEINIEGHKKPERWIMVEVEEAYVQCSKHIPLMQKMPKNIDWGTDSDAAKRVDFFQLNDIPLYNRVGGDKAMELAVDLFYRKVLADDFVAPFFEDVDMDGQRQKQKAFLAMAFGGPYQYTGLDLRKAHQRLVDELGMDDKHFEHILKLLKETLYELDLPEKPVEEMMSILATTRDDILCR
ncbi:MAG: pyridoxamine 5'-phosphate oxidase family protein [Gammaproteobacteria bacterium]